MAPAADADEMDGERLSAVADAVWQLLRRDCATPTDALTVLGCVCSGFLRVQDEAAQAAWLSTLLATLEHRRANYDA